MARRYLANQAALTITVAANGCSSPGASDSTDGESSADGESDTLDGMAFELVSADLDVSGQIVILSFSKPVGPVDDVDPSDFRISYALSYEVCDANGCVDETTYYDPNYYTYEYLGYGSGPGDRFLVDMVSNGTDPTTIALHFGLPLHSYLCYYIADYEAEYDYLFVHHAPGNIPLESADGESLAAIGAPFVHEPLAAVTVDGDFPNLDPKIPITCSL